MTVYVEYVLIDNFVIDFLILSATFTVTGSKNRRVKTAAAALLGAALALVYPLMETGGIFLTVGKVASGLLIVLVGGEYKDVKHYFVNAAVFFALTFAAGGAVTGIFSLLNIDYPTETAIALMIVPVYAAVLSLKAVIKYFFRRAPVEKNCYGCEIKNHGKTVRLKGFIDTGNAIYDKNSPVIVCGKKTALKIMGNAIPEIKYITVFTVAKEEKILSFKIEELKIFIGDEPNIFKNITVAVAKGNIGRDYDVILHPAFLEAKYVKSDRDTQKIS